MTQGDILTNVANFGFSVVDDVCQKAVEELSRSITTTQWRIYSSRLNS